MENREIVSLDKLIKSVLGSGYKSFQTREEDSSIIVESCFGETFLVDSSSKEGGWKNIFEKIFVPLREKYLFLSQLTIESFDRETNLLTLRNSNKKSFSFSSSSPLKSIMASVEFFVNAKSTYDTLIRCLKDAKKRSRFDLVDVYLDKLAQIVKVSDYSTKY